MNLKRPDTALLASAVALFLGAAYGLWFWLGADGLPAALGLLLAIVAGLQLHLHRTRQQEDVVMLRQVQALFGLYSRVPFRSDIPPMTSWAASPELAGTLFTLVTERRPRHVVELGSGVSSIIVAYALAQNEEGTLTSLDQDAAYAARTEEELRRHALTDRARVVHAPLREWKLDGQSWTWYDTDALPTAPPIDLLIVDGPHEQLQKLARYPALPVLADRLSPDAVVVLDDADRKDERRIVERWMEEFDGFTLDRLPSPKGTAILRRS